MPCNTDCRRWSTRLLQCIRPSAPADVRSDTDDVRLPGWHIHLHLLGSVQFTAARCCRRFDVTDRQQCFQNGPIIMSYTVASNEWLYFSRRTSSLEDAACTSIQSGSKIARHRIQRPAYFGDDFTGQMTQQLKVSYRWRTTVSQPSRGLILPGSAH